MTTTTTTKRRSYQTHGRNGTPTKRPNVSTQEERDRLILENYGLVGAVVSKCQDVLIEGCGSHQDAFSAGTLGLIRAAELYDPTKGAKFSTYAFPWIFQAIQRAAETNRLVRVPALRHTKEELMRAREAALVLRPLNDIKRDDLRSRDESADVPEKQEIIDMVRAAIDLLPPAWGIVLSLRMRGETCRNAGSAIGVGRERARRIEQEACAQLRKMLGPVFGEDNADA